MVTLGLQLSLECDARTSHDACKERECFVHSCTDEIVYLGSNTTAIT